MTQIVALKAWPEKLGRLALVSTTAMALVIGPLAGPAAARAKVGVTSAVIPEALMGGTPEELKIISVGDRVDQDVVVETGKRGRTQVLFVDGSSMNIGPSSRIIIDSFVFDPSELSGNIGARIETGSMRFIGGVLSKRAGQVKFDAGEATVGIRGGIAKVGLNGGALKAELIHGKLTVQTPEGLFETDRIGTLIERDISGAVDSRKVTAEESKAELDEEAKESFIDPLEAETPAPAAEAEADAPAETANEDVLAENPIDAGLVEVDADGNLKATDQLAEIDPEAADLIEEGALAVDESGNVAPTAKILEIDDTAKEMFEKGYLEVDENGFLVPSDDFKSANFYEDTEVDQSAFDSSFDVVSDKTLSEFNFAAPEEISEEAAFKLNAARTRRELASDPTTAKLFELGQIEQDEKTGLLVPSRSFNPVTLSRVESQLSRKRNTFVVDAAPEKFLLDGGVFDSKITTRVLGSDLAGNFFSEDVVKVVKADIVREDTINAIDRLADFNGVDLPSDIKERNLDELISFGGALSTQDAINARFGTGRYQEGSQKIEMDSIDGRIVLRTDTEAGKQEYEAEKVYTDLLSGGAGEGSGPSMEIYKRVLKTDESNPFERFGTSDGRLAPLFGTRDASGEVKEEAPLDDKIVFTPTEDLFPGDETPVTEEKIDLGDYGKSSFIGGLNTEFIDEEIGGQIIEIAKVTADPVVIFTPTREEEEEQEPEVYVDPTGDTAAAEQEEAIRAANEDTKEAEVLDQAVDVWTLSLAGQRYDRNANSGSADAYWRAYSTAGQEEESVVARFNDGRIDFRMNAGTHFGGSQTGDAVTVVPSDLFGSTSSLLNAISMKFYAEITDRANSKTGSRTTIHTLTSNSASRLRVKAQSAGSTVTPCSCDQIATGIWQTSSFTDRALENITYRHEGHWAIGAPLSGDTIRQLAGATVNFSGHAYGRYVDNSGTNGEGFGAVAVQIDYANPTNASRNTWTLSDFKVNGTTVVASQTVNLTHGNNGRYLGSTSTTVVDGGVHGSYTRDPSTLQTAGTFAINDATSAISGSYAAAGTSVTASPK